MVQKLKLISGRIPWSLVSRAAAFGAAWYLLPFSVFAVLAVLLYTIPWFGVRTFIWPFLTLLVLLFVFKQSVVLAVVAAFAFFCMLGVKDLIFLLRADRYETLIALLVVLIAAALFRGSLSPLMLGALAGISMFALLAGYFGYTEGSAPPPRDAVLAAGVSALLLGAFAYAMSFAPLVPLAEMALFSAAGIVLAELGSAAAHGRVPRSSALGALSAFFAVFVVTLTATTWGI